MVKKLFLTTVILLGLLAIAVNAQNITSRPISGEVIYLTKIGNNPSNFMGNLPNNTVRVNKLADIPHISEVASLIIDSTAIDDLDWVLINTLYEQGKPLVFTNVSSAFVGSQLGDSCINRMNVSANPNASIVVSLKVSGDNASEVATIRRAHMLTCGEEIIEGITSSVSVSYRYTFVEQMNLTHLDEILEEHIRTQQGK